MQKQWRAIRKDVLCTTARFQRKYESWRRTKQPTQNFKYPACGHSYTEKNDSCIKHKGLVKSCASAVDKSGAGKRDMTSHSLPTSFHFFFFAKMAKGDRFLYTIFNLIIAFTNNELKTFATFTWCIPPKKGINSPHYLLINSSGLVSNMKIACVVAREHGC